jgi:AhpD family alkylhydroperoxidase
MAGGRKRQFTFWPEAYENLRGLNALVKESGIEMPLLELVRMRASQINGCAFCIDMHSKDARAAGETEQRLYALNAWRETTFFSEREQAALALTEAVTELAVAHIPDSVVDQASTVFSRQEMTALVYAIIEINSWNRLVLATGAPEAGSYTLAAE